MQPTVRRVPPAMSRLVLAAQLLVVADLAVVTLALPSIGADLGAGAAELPWVLAAYPLAFGALLLPGLRLRGFLPGLAVFAAAALVAGTAVAGPVLVAARVAQGIGAALVSGAALGEARGRLLRWWLGLDAVAAVAGVAVGGQVVSWFGWRAVFLGMGALGALLLTTRVATRTGTGDRATAVSARAAAAVGAVGDHAVDRPAAAGRATVRTATHPADRAERARSRWGAAAMAAAVVLVVAGCVAAGRGAVPAGIVAVVLGAVCVAGFVLVEPPFTVAAARRAGVLVAAGAAALFAVGFVVASVQLQREGLSPARAALVVLPALAAAAAVVPVAPRLALAVGPRVTAHLGFSGAALGFWLLSTGLVAAGLATVTACLAAIGAAGARGVGREATGLLAGYHQLGLVLGIAVAAQATVDASYLTAVGVAAVLAVVPVVLPAKR